MARETEAWEEKWRRLRTASPAALRDRVLQASRDELGCVAAATPATWRWQPFAATAVMALLWIHASWSATLDTRLRTDVDRSEERSRRALELHELLPDLSSTETRRLALVMDAGLRTPSSSMLRGR